MRWLVTGAGGQLGSELVGALDGAAVTAPTHAELDVTNADDVAAAVAGMDVVVNAAAWTDVDGAEAHEAAAAAVNAVAPAHLAAACATAGATLVHVSTDYVFAGDARTPYREDAPIASCSAYGRTKAGGERAVLDSGARAYVVRTAWLYGASGANFVRTMARLERERDTVDVVDDQRGSPTWSADLAQALIALARSDAPPGVYHCTNGGETTWYGLARAVFAELGADPDRVRPTTTDRFPRPAPRPAYSVLCTGKWRAAGLPPMRPWSYARTVAWRQGG
jgi:dTDP-4-dehydrorhamnose reductase